MSDAISSSPNVQDSDCTVSSVEYSGRLTDSEYDRWFKKDSFYNDSARGSISLSGFRALQNSRIYREFEHLSKSEFVLDNFFSLPNVFRKCVSIFAAGYSPLIEVFTCLALQVPAFDDREARILSDADVVFYYEDLLFDGSTEDKRDTFDEAMWKFVTPCDDSVDSNCSRIMLSMLCLLYGTEQVVEIMHWWNSVGGSSLSTAYFVPVVENWKPEFEELPLRWVVSIVSGSNVE